MKKYSNNDSNKEIECSLLNQIYIPTKRAKEPNVHYYPILQVCMNTSKGRENIKNFYPYYIVDLVPQI